MTTTGNPGHSSGALLEVRNLGHSYGPNVIFQNLDFSVGRGEFMCIVGPSGVGKTTLLQLLGGLREPTEGKVVFEGEVVKQTPKGLAIVFQDYSRSLMPWLSVLDNVMLPLRSAGLKAAERRERGLTALAQVGLADHVTKYPWEMSGGMQQRVAIARALAYKPHAIIMDEPFASVDAQTRADLEDLVLDLRNTLGITVLLVTHDIDEAVYLADRVLVLSGKPAEIAAIIPVPLPQPRDQSGTKLLHEFAELRNEVYHLIRPSAVTTETPVVPPEQL